MEKYKDDIKRLNSLEEFSFEDFVKTVEILRELCPWDKEQTHTSIRKNLIEEAYEVVEGIDRNDPKIMKEELGDLMLQVVFHSIMGKEDGEYDVYSVMTDVCKKLIRRHPHIFAEVYADTTDKVLENWENIKKEEKENKTLSDELSSISSSLPALMRSEKVCKKIRKRTGNVFDDMPLTEEEAGELLFKLTSRCDNSGIDAEEALFRYTERKIKEYENK
ncbi:MAG: MazG family protein [Ruminococcaceae bacterium]|nr:MazG family protein [Oscillospiraceae bacterium]